MPDDARTVPVTFDVDPDTAAALQDPVLRSQVGRLLGDLIRSGAAERPAVVPGISEVPTASHGVGNDAVPDDLVERFRRFRVGKTLGGLDLKEMITEGRR